MHSLDIIDVTGCYQVKYEQCSEVPQACCLSKIMMYKADLVDGTMGVTTHDVCIELWLQDLLNRTCSAKVKQSVPNIAQS